MKCDITGRLLANVERVGALFGVPIADGYALVLAQMLGPGLDDDGFEVAARLRRVAEQTRAKCAVSQTLLPYRLHGIGSAEHPSVQQGNRQIHARDRGQCGIR